MTPLEVLLQHLQVETLILTGLTSNSCITVTAHDANMRGFDIYIPPDCSSARDAEEHKQAFGAIRGDGWSQPHAFDFAEAPESHPCSEEVATCRCGVLVEIYSTFETVSTDGLQDLRFPLPAVLLCRSGWWWIGSGIPTR